MRLVYLPSCAQDLLWMRRYYTQVFPAGQNNAANHFRKIRAAILTNPMIGREISGENVREVFIPKTDFSYLYRVKPDRIEILRIFDNRAPKTYPSSL